MDVSEQDILRMYESKWAETEYIVPDETIEELNSLRILVMDPCESHLIETRLAHPPTDSQKESLAHFDVILGSQKFTVEEDDIITKNWEKFKQEYEFEDPKLFMQPYLAPKERIHFVQYLGRGLPKRTLYSIFGRFRRLFSEVNEGQFTPEEDLLITHQFDLFGKRDPFSSLAKLLNRERIAVFKRYNYILNKEECERVSWTLDKSAILLKGLIQVTKNELECFKDKPIPWRTWLKVKKVTGFPAALMKSLWHRKLYAQLYSTEPLYLNKLRIYLIRRLYKSHIIHWQEINWEEIAKDFDGINPMFLWTVMHRTLRKQFPDYRTRNVREMMKCLKGDYTKELRNRTKDFRLQRICLTDSGELVFKEKRGWHIIGSDETQ